MLSQTPKRVYDNVGSTTRISMLMGDNFSHGGARSHGDVWAGLTNGIATGFLMDAIVPEVSTATQTPQMLVATAAGGDLATPVAYWFQRHPLRLRVGSTNADAVPATSGVLPYSTTRADARGILRMGLGDVNAAAQIILDQGGMTPITTAKDFEVHFDIAGVTNGNILATSGFCDIGVFGGVVGVDPSAVAHAAGFFFKITAGRVYLYSTATTNTLIGTAMLPTADRFVLSIIYDATQRSLLGCIDGNTIGGSAYTLPAATTAVEVGMRACHLAAYTAASHAPLTVDVDSLIVHQLAYGATITS